MRRVTPQVYYTFTPALKLVSIPGYIAQQRLLLITDVSNNTVIYNFSDPNLLATFAYDYVTNPGSVITNITVAYNTTGSGFKSTDQLQILVDEQADYVTPFETQLDPVGKSRVSEPQALIDTDFEYGLQPTKWETVGLTNNKPSFAINYQSPLTINDINATNASSTFTVNVGFTAGTGTISTSGNAVTGTSTLFTQQLQTGFYIFNNSLAPIGQVSVINNDTSVTLVANALNAGGGAAFSFMNQPLPTVGQPMLVQDSNFPGANGSFTIENVNQYGNGLVATSRYAYTGTTGSINNPSATAVYPGQLYTGAAYNLNASVSNITFSGTQATFAFNNPHGLQVGNGILVSNSNVATFNGSWTVTGFTNDSNVTVNLNATPASGSNVANVIPRTDIVISHRAFDGGVFFTTGNPVAHNVAVIRQTRRYFRYQSGKGIQVSTGTIVKPQIPVDTVTANTTTPGALITIKTKTAHYLSAGANIYLGNTATVSTGGVGSTPINGITSGYAGAYTVQQTPDAYTINVYAQQTLGSTTLTGIPNLGPNSWYGSKVRMGLFEQQNGLYWEFDGQNLYAVRRSSTQQLSGYVSVTQGSSTVTGITAPDGTLTQFANQLQPSDYIVIRGQTYRVLQILSNTSLTITPAYRGASISQCQISKTQDYKILQSQFNIDRLDGTGPSGYTIDLTKIQMWYVDYSWYGAGFVRWGVRTVDGQIYYAHKLQHNNIQYLSYMRSGNLPGHYEVNNEVPETQLTATFASSATTLNVANTASFPPTGGILLIKDYNNQEYVTYDTVTTTSFNVITRGQTATSVASVNTTSGNCNVTTSTSVTNVQAGMYVTGTGLLSNTYIQKVTYGSPNTITLNQAPTATGSITMSTLTMANANATHTYSATQPIGIQQHAPFFTPQIAHWGTSVIMDGKFDNDKSYIFIAGMPSSISVGQNQRTALLSLRIAPSVQSGNPGVLGTKELINHMQLTPFAMDIASNGLFLMTLVLNGVTSSPTSSLYQNVGGSSLTQVAYHPVGSTINSGETIFAFFAATAGGTTYAVTQQDLTAVRDLGNSILGGGQTNTAGQQIYPDGPDVLTIVCQNIDSGSKNIQARISWQEAQA
jgi:hypothetical protein